MLFPLLIAALVFWIVQLIDLLRRDVTDFESQAHKLIWFIAFMVGHIIAACWYYNWKRKLEHPVGSAVAVP